MVDYSCWSIQRVWWNDKLIFTTLKLKKKIELKKEILYLLLLSIVTVYFAYSTHTPNKTYMVSGILGTLLILTWFIRAFVLYSGRKISKYSEVIQRISIKDRFFIYFVLPILFYGSLLLYLYFNTSFTMDMVLVLVSIILLLILFLNVKSSFRKIYSVEQQTRAIFDFICIAAFYLLSSVIIRLAIPMWSSLLILFVVSLLLFWSDIKIHRHENIQSLLITTLSALFVCATSGIFFNSNIFIIPAISTLSFYLILSLWNIRFAGKLKLVDYLLPFIYSVLALILILKV